MRNLDEAITSGLSFVKADEDLDLDAEEMMALYEKFLARDQDLSLLGAVTLTAHDAFLIGVAFGRESLFKTIRLMSGDENSNENSF